MDSLIRQNYERDGYLIVPALLGHSEVDELVAEARAISLGERGDIEGFQQMGTAQENENSDISNRLIAIHFPHKVSALMLRTLKQPQIVNILTDLLGPNIKAMQSMLFFKQAGRPGQAWHQDEFYIPTRDRSLTGVWIALDDATIENGCLWILPGSQVPGVVILRVLTCARAVKHGVKAKRETICALSVPVEISPREPWSCASGSVIMSEWSLKRNNSMAGDCWVSLLRLRWCWQ